MINYSIIIPHKNIPDLLQRCLDSIPRRSDVQIIVVDDNSDADKVDFSNFSGLNDPYIEVIFGKNENGRKGAGYARNLGLERAKGKWLIFADADDFFNPCFEEALDKYRDNESDIVYFYVNSVISDTLEKANRGNYINDALDLISETKNWDIALGAFSPCGKFIKKNLLEMNKIRFQETEYSNDVFFSVKSALLASLKFIETDKVIYCITQREESLTAKDTIKSTKIRFNVACKTVSFLKQYGKEELLFYATYSRWLFLYQANKILGICLFPKLIRSSGRKMYKYIRFSGDFYDIKQSFFWKKTKELKYKYVK